MKRSNRLALLSSENNGGVVVRIRNSAMKQLKYNLVGLSYIQIRIIHYKPTTNLAVVHPLISWKMST